MNRNGLKVTASKSGIRITISAKALKWAAEHHEQYWQPITNKFALVVSDPVQFAADVCAALEDEEEDGSTPVHRLLDAAIDSAVNDGSEGLDHDAMDVIQEAERTAESE